MSKKILPIILFLSALCFGLVGSNIEPNKYLLWITIASIILVGIVAGIILYKDRHNK